jgi:hypothetical protein
MSLCKVYFLTLPYQEPFFPDGAGFSKLFPPRLTARASSGSLDPYQVQPQIAQVHLIRKHHGRDRLIVPKEHLPAVADGPQAAQRLTASMLIGR